MATQQMSAVSSFVYLTDNIPDWATQLASLTKYAADKNAEFVAEYAKVVSKIKPKRLKSPSLNSIHSIEDKSVHLSQIDPHNENTLPEPPGPIEIDPLEAGNKYLYAQAQRKRKPGTSIRSGASGPQKFRSKNQVIIYYDSHVQNQLDSMVKAVGSARNNLRKGKNALIASRGFKLPALSRKYNTSWHTPSLENIHSQSPSYDSPKLSGKYALRSSSQAPADEDEACFADVDKMLEGVQNLYETAAHQFLRDGDCRTELESAKAQLDMVLEKAKPTVETLKEKARKEEEAAAEEEAESRGADSETTLCFAPSTEHLNISYNKMAPTSLSQTLEDMKTRSALNAQARLTTAADTALPTAGMAIEVDEDASNDDSVTDIDISQFCMNNARRLRV